jgi:hypothetical protein
MKSKTKLVFLFHLTETLVPDDRNSDDKFALDEQINTKKKTVYNMLSSYSILCLSTELVSKANHTYILMRHT